MKLKTFCVAVALLVLGVPLHAADFRQLSCQGNSAPTGFVATPGIVMAWGANNFGQLGNGDNTSSNVPVQVAGLTDVAQVSAGTFHSLAVKCDGTVWALTRSDFLALKTSRQRRFSTFLRATPITPWKM